LVSSSLDAQGRSLEAWHDAFRGALRYEHIRCPPKEPARGASKFVHRRGERFLGASLKPRYQSEKDFLSPEERHETRGVPARKAAILKETRLPKAARKALARIVPSR
jgi:hypothetical protein